MKYFRPRLTQFGMRILYPIGPVVSLGGLEFRDAPLMEGPGTWYRYSESKTLVQGSIVD